LIAQQVLFLELKNLDWSAVKRTVFFAYQQFQYVYPSEVDDLTQRLLVKPRQNYGGQLLLDFKLAVEPIPVSMTTLHGDFGNTVLQLEVAHISHWTSFEVMFAVQNTINSRIPEVSRSQVGQFKKATGLTKANGLILEVAKGLLGQSATPLEFATRASDWVSNTMQYKSGATNVQTSAAQALEIGAGLCQDYSHILLALCRAANIPAQYVSGHMLGEGGSHAWVEVLIPNELGKFQAMGFDPTNARVPNLGYTIVAVGKDYNDVPPTSGRFMGDSMGELHFEKFAGLLELEFKSGEILRP
jgi:transglutaminase-like putative cysteine protease